MTRICAWCHAVLGVKPGVGVTHGICPACRDEFMGVPPRVAKKDFEVGQRFELLGHVVRVVAITKRGLALRFVSDKAEVAA